MNHKAEQYITQALAATGFVLVNPQLACMLRPDLWRGVQDAATSLPNGDDIEKFLADHTRILFTFAGSHSGYGGCFNVNRLEERALELYGLRLSFTKVTAEELLGPPAPSTTPAFSQRLDDSVEKLRNLAAQVPPAHDCPLRTEILNARHQLGMEAA